MPADYFNACCYATSLSTMKHAVTSPIKLSLFPWNDGWRISPRKRLDSRTDGDRRYEEPVWYRSLKSIDRKEKVSKMIINTSIIARFQFHPRYRSLLWESCTCPNGDAWLSMRGQSVFWTRDLRCQLTSGNINDQHSFQRVFVLSCPTTCTVQLNKRLPSFVILTPWMFVTIKYMMELDFLLDRSMHQIGDKKWHKLLLVFRFEKAEETWKILFVTRVSCSPRIQNLRGK